MNDRRLLLLLGLLLVLAAAAWLLSRPATPPAVGQGEPLLPGLDKALNSLEEIVVTGPGGQLIATLRRKPDGWTVAEASDYPADIGRLRSLLLGLARARIVEAKTARPDLHDRLGVEDIGRDDATGVKIDLRSPAWSGSVIIGQSGIGGSMSYVRRADEDQAYLVDQQLEPGKTLRDWLDRRVLDIPARNVRRVTIEHPDGETLVIEKPDPDATDFNVLDIPEGRKLSYPGVANAIGAALSGLQFETVMPATELPPPATPPVLARFETFDGLTIEARSWRVDDGHLVAFSAFATAPPAMAAAASDNGTSSEATGAGSAEAADQNAAEPDPASRAAELNRRLGGWLYRLPDYKTDQLIRRMNDLLAATD